jgi:myo-inositol-1(or 4)-monophosphatase
MTDVETAIALVVEGAAVARRRFGTAIERIEKEGDDFTTTVDLEAEVAMLAILERTCPGDSALAEYSRTE